MPDESTRVPPPTSPDVEDDVDDDGDGDGDGEASAGVDDDPMRDAAAAIDEARRRVAEAPVELVVTNHVMGLYELAAIHLSEPSPDLRAAALAIDAVACLVEGLGDRLGEDAVTMRDALANIRLAFVSVKGRPAADQPA